MHNLTAVCADIFSDCHVTTLQTCVTGSILRARGGAQCYIVFVMKLATKSLQS